MQMLSEADVTLATLLKTWLINWSSPNGSDWAVYTNQRRKKKNHIKLRMKTQALAGMIWSVNLCGNPRTMSRYLTKSR